jgi:hypothetical protein
MYAQCKYESETEALRQELTNRAFLGAIPGFTLLVLITSTTQQNPTGIHGFDNQNDDNVLAYYLRPPGFMKAHLAEMIKMHEEGWFYAPI